MTRTRSTSPDLVPAVVIVDRQAAATAATLARTVLAMVDPDATASAFAWRDPWMYPEECRRSLVLGNALSDARLWAFHQLRDLPGNVPGVNMVRTKMIGNTTCVHAEDWHRITRTLARTAPDKADWSGAIKLLVASAKETAAARGTADSTF